MKYCNTINDTDNHNQTFMQSGCPKGPLSFLLKAKITATCGQLAQADAKSVQFVITL